MPLPDASVDVIISNCVINLSQDKPRVMREMMRVLRPGGRLAISDTVADRPVSEEAKNNEELWCACISGAPQPEEYRQLLVEAGFVDVEVDVAGWDDGDKEGRGFRVGSAFISGFKPVQKPGTTRIEPATQADMAEVFALLESEGLPTDDLAEGTCNLIVLREKDGRISGVGGIEFHGNQALLRSLCVRPDFRGRGIGTRLTAALIRMARAQGCKEAYILTETAPDFARKRGFTVVGRDQVKGPVTESSQFRAACPNTATVLRMNLAYCC